MDNACVRSIVCIFVHLKKKKIKNKNLKSWLNPKLLIRNRTIHPVLHKTKTPSALFLILELDEEVKKRSNA